MALTNLTSIIDRVGNDPLLTNRVTVTGARIGGNANSLPVEQQFPAMSVGTAFDGRTAASWVRNRNQQVKRYRGSPHMAIGAIAKMVAMQDVIVQRRFKPKNGKTGIKYERQSYTHPLVELLEEVNPVDTIYDLWYYMVGWRLTTGDSMIFKARNGFGSPKQLWPLPSQWTRVIPDPTIGVKGYEVDGQAGTFFVDAKNMIHVKDPSLDWEGHGRYYGHAAIDAAETTITLEQEMLNRLYYTFKNFAPPGMVFSTDQRMQPHQVHQLWANLSAQHSMSEHSGRPMIVHSGLKLEGQFGGSSPKELDYVGSLDKTLEITLATCGVPKSVLGMSEGMNKASAEASFVQFCKMTIDPLLKQFSQHLTQDLATDFAEDKSLVIKIGPCAVDKEEQLVKMVEAMIKAGAITPDEVRETLMDMDPLDSPHGSKAIMVSGFQAIDPVTGKPDETGAPPIPEKGAPESDTVEVGRQALSGSQS
jgi:HK97 family phage portal protein